MKEKESKGQRGRNDLARAGWDNEGGAIQPDADWEKTLGEAEQRILRRLGAAMIAKWNDLPTEMQRQLFQHAVSTGEPRDVSQLKEEIARFLHNHKDDEAGQTSGATKIPR